MAETRRRGQAKVKVASVCVHQLVAFRQEFRVDRRAALDGRGERGERGGCEGGKQILRLGVRCHKAMHRTFEAEGAAKTERNVAFSTVARLHSQHYEGATRSKLKFTNWVAAPFVRVACSLQHSTTHIRPRLMLMPKCGPDWS